MSIITKKFFTPGSQPTAAELNAPYDSLAADTVDGENTADRWINREIVYEAGVQPNELYYTGYNGSTVMVTSSTAETVVNNGGNRRITLNYTATNDIVLRATVDGVVAEMDVADWSTNSWYNLYQFSIWVTYNTIDQVRLTYGNYSFNKMAHALVAGTPAVTQKPIQWRNFQIGGLLTFPPGTVINNVELRVKVGNGANVLQIGRSNLTLVIAEN